MKRGEHSSLRDPGCQECSTMCRSGGPSPRVSQQWNGWWEGSTLRIMARTTLTTIGWPEQEDRLCATYP